MVASLMIPYPVEGEQGGERVRVKFQTFVMEPRLVHFVRDEVGYRFEPHTAACHYCMSEGDCTRIVQRTTIEVKHKGERRVLDMNNDLFRQVASAIHRYNKRFTMTDFDIYRTGFGINTRYHVEEAKAEAEPPSPERVRGMTRATQHELDAPGWKV